MTRDSCFRPRHAFQCVDLSRSGFGVLALPLIGSLTACLATPLATDAAWGFSQVAVGDTVGNVELPALGGGSRYLLADSAANVFVFFKPGQDHSRATLRSLASLEKEMAERPVHWVAIVSDRIPAAEARAEVETTGVAMVVLIDVGDELYGRLGVPLTPMIGITDRGGTLVASVPYAQVNYATIIRAHILHLLREITDDELEKALHPPRAVQGGSSATAHRRFMLAERLFQAGVYSKAKESVMISIAHDSTQADAYVLLGKILVAEGNCVHALSAFQHALALDPEHAAALEGRRNCADNGQH